MRGKKEALGGKYEKRFLVDNFTTVGSRELEEKETLPRSESKTSFFAKKAWIETCEFAPKYSQVNTPRPHHHIRE